MDRLRKRIWDNWHRSERMSRYYSKRARQISVRFKFFTFGIALVPIFALFLAQSELPYPHWLIPILLSAVGFAQFALIHYELGGDAKAAKIMANQTTELAQQWRDVWNNPDCVDILPWVDKLERHALAITTESIPYREDVNNECFDETENELRNQS